MRETSTACRHRRRSVANIINRPRHRGKNVNMSAFHRRRSVALRGRHHIGGGGISRLVSASRNNGMLQVLYWHQEASSGIPAVRVARGDGSILVLAAGSFAPRQ